ncbi:MAG: phage head closure protein [Pseudomonadota bacterium]
MSEFSGALCERISFERRSDARDLIAGVRGKWSYDGAAWAAVTPLAPAEQIEADALSAAPRWRVTVRKRDGIDLNSRIVWRGRYLRVRSVESDPRAPAQMTLTTQEQR